MFVQITSEHFVIRHLPLYFNDRCCSENGHIQWDEALSKQKPKIRKQCFMLCNINVNIVDFVHNNAFRLVKYSQHQPCTHLDDHSSIAMNLCGEYFNLFPNFNTMIATNKRCVFSCEVLSRNRNCILVPIIISGWGLCMDISSHVNIFFISGIGPNFHPRHQVCLKLGWTYIRISFKSS